MEPEENGCIAYSIPKVTVVDLGKSVQTSICKNGYHFNTVYFPGTPFKALSVAAEHNPNTGDDAHGAIYHLGKFSF